MRIWLAIFITCSMLNATDDLAFSQAPSADEPVYTLQLFSSMDLERAKRSLQAVPERHRAQTRLYRIGKYYTGRYGQDASYSAVKSALPDFLAAGYKDAYVVRSNRAKMHNELLREQTQHPEQGRVVPEEQTIETVQRTPLNQRSKAKVVSKAQQAYERGDDVQAMLYYEMLVASGDAPREAVSNLCYLYGKEGAWFQAKALIEKQRHISDLLYAYAYGALETGDENFYRDLSAYIPLDKSGRLMLLCGYYFERRGDMERAGSFYDMAFEANPSDPYIVYALARFADMRRDVEKALRLYAQVLNRSKADAQLKANAKGRITLLGG